MKKSKLLFLTPAVALATITPIVSCASKPTWTIDDVESAIFNPHNQKSSEPIIPPEDTFYKSFNTLSDKDKQKELIYAIYAPLIYLGKWGETSLLPNNKAIYDLWNDNIVTTSANVSVCSIETKDDKIVANFRGYVNFVFLKDWEGFKTNNFIQITLILSNQNVMPTPSTNWFLKLGTLQQPKCWGMFQIQRDETQLFYIPTLGTDQYPGFSSFPKNWHNWQK